eukprot:5922090-Amphidinium_carterae.1
MPFQLAILAESNHIAAEVRDKKTLPNQTEGTTTFHLAWTHPVRQPGDHHRVGRASAGLVMASTLPLCSHPLAHEAVDAMDKLGRLICRRLEFAAGQWLNVFGVYAPVTGWDHNSEANSQFLAQLFEAVLASPDEHNLVIGDYNVPFLEDALSQSVQARGVLVDLGHIFLREGEQRPPTYRTRSSESVIDRAMCSPSLLPFIDAMTICTNSGFGPHQPLVIELRAVHNKPPPMLSEVLPIPIAAGPVAPAVVLDWQLTNAGRMDECRRLLDAGNNEQAYHIWAALWENFLQHTAPEQANWHKFTGRATAKANFRQPGAQRQHTQLQSEEEKTLWKILGLLQGHRQGRDTACARLRDKAERLIAGISARRSLPPVVWDCDEQCAKLEHAVRHAIKRERLTRIAKRSREWKGELNMSAGVNRLSRKMIRGPSSRLLVLLADSDAYTNPTMQCEELQRAWEPILTGLEDTVVHQDIWQNIAHSRCVVPRITGEELAGQAAHLRLGSANGPDWWRPAE